MQEPVVRLEEVTFTYAGSSGPALRGINLTIQPGEFVAITGPSGCGKSTLSFCLTGFIPHSFDGCMEGRAVIGGRDTRSIAAGELAGIAGLVQQDPEAQLCTLHVAEEVAFGPENLGLPAPEIRRRLDWALAAAGIDHLRERSLHTLSGGEKQRVAIAGVLAMRPRLLILDEPTANLDPRGCREVLAVVERLRREQNAAVIIFEHRLQHLLPLADRLIIMDNGRIAADSIPAAEALNGRKEKPDLAEKPAPPPCSGMSGLIGPGSFQSDAPLLSVRELTVSYDQKTALKDVTFALHPGETMALMGNNGCGKSTLLLALLGILSPDRGGIYLDGSDLAGSKVTLRARGMGLTFQNPNHQLFEKTVLREAALPAHFLAGGKAEENEAAVCKLLHRFDLKRYREKLPFSLSLGEKKRLTLVSVLAYRPPILLLDEPIVGQDQDRVDLLMKALAEHSRRGGVTIMACHEPYVVEACCTRVLFLEQGEPLFDAPTAGAFEELYRLGREDYLPTGWVTALSHKGSK